MEQEFPHLSVKVASIGDLFVTADQFALPWFQRSYAWSEDHVARLVSEIEEAAETSAENRYFLGHVRLARSMTLGHRIIDGQQRILTLTMLFALLRDYCPEGEDTAQLDQLLWSDGESDDAERRPRISVQRNVREFLRAAVLDPGATTIAIDPSSDELTETERRFVANRNRMATAVEPMQTDAARWRRFVRFLVQRCYVILETVESEEEAWEMLAKEEERRVAHHPSEQAKATMISVMVRGHQTEAGRIWDDIQGRLTQDQLSRLLDHMRTMLLKRRSARPVIAELADGYALDRLGLAFMRETMLPHAQNFEAILSRTLGTGRVGEQIARKLALLELVGDDLWVAPLLRWLLLNPGQHRETLALVNALDRLTMMLKVGSIDPTARERRFIALTSQIGPRSRITELSRLTVEPALRRDCQQNLRSRTLQYKRYASYVLSRASLLLAGADEPVTGKTIEHVLPRNPPGDAQWRAEFASDRIVDDHTHRLGNLVLLSFRDNQAAANLDFEAKREILGGSEYAIARDAAKEAIWTPNTIKARTERLAALLLDDRDSAVDAMELEVV